MTLCVEYEPPLNVDKVAHTAKMTVASAIWFNHGSFFSVELLMLEKFVCQPNIVAWPTEKAGAGSGFVSPSQRLITCWLLGLQRMLPFQPCVQPCVDAWLPRRLGRGLLPQLVLRLWLGRLLRVLVRTMPQRSKTGW